MIDDISRVLLTKEQISVRVAQLGEEISENFHGKVPLFIGVLKGSFVFMADLIRAVDLECSIDFMAVSSYGSGTESTGAVQIRKDLDDNPSGRHLILVEDILDSGMTLNYLVSYLSNQRPASITVVTLLDKPARRKAPVEARFVGFKVPDEFVVGYGLDYGEKYRNLPYIGALKPEIYEGPQS